MKKTYSNPEILFEDFSLNNSITVGCEKIAQSTEYACTYDVHTSAGTMMIFTDQVEGCTTKKADGEYKEICYHIPTANNNVFTS